MTRTLITLIAFTIVAASCSSQGDTSQVATLDSGTTGSSSAVSEEVDPLTESEEAMLAFTQCFRDRGIDIGDPTVGADGSLQLPPIEFTVESDGLEGGEPDLSAFEELMAPCEELLSGVVSQGTSGNDSGFEDAMVEYTQCMRDNGIDMPDPDFSGNGGIIDLGAGGTDDGDFEAADAICRSVFESFSISE
jgi:hypothetical protein